MGRHVDINGGYFMLRSFWGSTCLTRATIAVIRLILHHNYGDISTPPQLCAVVRSSLYSSAGFIVLDIFPRRGLDFLNSLNPACWDNRAVRVLVRRVIINPIDHHYGTTLPSFIRTQGEGSPGKALRDWETRPRLLSCNVQESPNWRTRSPRDHSARGRSRRYCSPSNSYQAQPTPPQPWYDFDFSSADLLRWFGQCTSFICGISICNNRAETTPARFSS